MNRLVATAWGILLVAPAWFSLDYFSIINQDFPKALRYTFLISGILTPVMTIASLLIRVVFGSAITYGQIAQSILASFSSACVLSFSFVLIGNELLDRSPVETHYVRVMSAGPRATRKRSYYYAYVSPWKSRQSSEKIESSWRFPRDIFKGLSQGDVVEVQTKPGRFGLETIVGFRKAP